jgi:hypothetical protein
MSRQDIAVARGAMRAQFAAARKALRGGDLYEFAFFRTLARRTLRWLSRNFA